MLRYLFVFAFFIFIISCTFKSKPTEVTVVGTLHFPTKNINSDSIYNVLKDVNPDFILMEADSSIFNNDFSFKKTFDENEFNAVVKYLKEKPNVQVRPIEFEGRNNYRKSIGIYPEAKLVFEKFNTLNKEKKYSANEQKVWDGFVHCWLLSDSISKKNLKGLNNKNTDKIIDSLMKYQYVKLKRISENRIEFENAGLIDAKGDTISLKTYFQKWSKFEGVTRNKALAENALRIIKNNPSHRVVVLTGYKHRFYTLNFLEKHQTKYNFVLKEFYDYK